MLGSRCLRLLLKFLNQLLKGNNSQFVLLACVLRVLPERYRQLLNLLKLIRAKVCEFVELCKRQRIVAQRRLS